MKEGGFRWSFDQFAEEMREGQKRLEGTVDRVETKLDGHLADHTHALEDKLKIAKERMTKRSELWITGIIGVAGVLIGLAALYK